MSSRYHCPCVHASYLRLSHGKQMTAYTFKYTYHPLDVSDLLCDPGDARDDTLHLLSTDLASTVMFQRAFLFRENSINDLYMASVSLPICDYCENRDNHTKCMIRLRF